MTQREIRKKFDEIVACSTERLMTVESFWTRPANLNGNPVHFESINVRLDGHQPQLRLHCSVETRWERDGRPALIAIEKNKMIWLGIRAAIKRRHVYARWRRVYARLKNYTMVDEETFCHNLFLAKMVQNVSGCVIECGVWRGGMSAGLCLALGSSRTYFLFDSFQGLPPAQTIVGPAAIRYQQDRDSPSYYDNCTAPEQFARQAMELAGARTFTLMPGWFSETLPTFKPPEPIALLRLDGDWYDSTITCLEHLFDRVARNGIIIVDDYYTWDGCSRAVHDFLSERKATERIRSYNGSICYLLKEAQAR
jgi:O-methyltransferase